MADAELRAQMLAHLPQSGSMRVIDECLLLSEERALCRTQLKSDCAFVSDAAGRSRSLIALEYFAQSAALLFGFRARASGQPSAGGLLLAVRDACFSEPWFDVGSTFDIEVQLDWWSGQDARFLGSLWPIDRVHDGQGLATATISVRQAPSKLDSDSQ